MNLLARISYLFWDILCDHHKAKAHQATKDAMYHQAMWRASNDQRAVAFNRIFGIKGGAQ
jgi:hypothetical protein